MTNIRVMHSGRDRLVNDDYKTIDTRCVYGFLQYFTPDGLIVDPCSPSGSGIVDTLIECGFKAEGRPDAFAADFGADVDWLVFNPPYIRPDVDKILLRQIARVRAGEVNGAAALLRHNFDFAKHRNPMFEDCPLYFGQIRLQFRPWWFEPQPGDPQPFWQFVWHVWLRGKSDLNHYVLYSKGEKP